MSVTVGLLIDALSGALLTALGLFVATRRPWRPVNLAFAVFSIGWGLVFAITNITRAVGASATYEVAAGAIAPPIALAAAGAMVFLAHRFPSRLQAPVWVRLIGWAALAALPTIAALAYRSGGFQGTSAERVPVGTVFGVSSLWGAMFLALILFAWGGLTAVSGGETGRTRQLALVSLALALDPGVRAGVEATAGNGLPFALGAVVITVAITWLVAMVRAPPSTRRVARATGLVMLALPVIGMLVRGPLGGYPAAADSGVLGVARTAAVLVFAYAILRHQLLDLDVRVKWTIKQSTLAAIFIATFFVVSEGAAAVFEEQTGSTILGILAAGALVFAIVPLQRFAERVSDRAMPGVKPVGEMNDDERSRVYREAAAQAWADGRLTDDERAVLDQLRSSLGIDAEQALAVERDLAGGGD